MYEFLERDIYYAIRVEEILWGCVLLAITLIIHAIGVFRIVRTSAKLMVWVEARLPGLRAAVFALTSLTIVVLHLIEVVLWAAFFTWQGAQPNASSAFYNALVNYTTLGAGYLPIRWRLLEGVLGMAGLLSFAFSTSALLALAQQLLHIDFGEQQAVNGRGGRGASKTPIS